MKYAFLILSCWCLNSVAQSNLLNPTWNTSITGWYSNNNNTPFWVISNQNGKIKNTRNNTIATASIASSDSIGNFYISYKYEGNARTTSFENKYWTQEIWGEVRYKSLYINGGRKTELFGINDSLLSSGGASWSTNARPMPKISVGIYEFITIPYTNSILAFKGCLEHGWFEYNRYTHSPFLHHKNLYLRATVSPNYHVFWGVEHFAQWGGTSSNPKLGKLPSSVSDYFRVFTARSSSSTDPNLWSESANKLGNHLGSFQFGMDAQFSSFALLAYHQSFFEDGSGISLKRKNRADGIWGISLNLKKQSYLNRFVYEYIHTTWQSGTVDAKNAVSGIGGLDNYYNNGIYLSGWTYYGYTLGTPFISSPALLGNANGSINNRVIAHYLSCMGDIPNVFSYKLKTSYSQNFGTYFKPYTNKKEQYSFLLELTKALPFKQNISAGIQMAADYGDLIGNHYAIGFCIKANGLFSK